MTFPIARIPYVLVASLFVALVACSKAAAGESCQLDADCTSGTCALNFHCSPGECECSGAECGSTRSSCAEGHVCIAGQPPFEVGYNRCRATCSGSKPCAGGHACTNGFCGTETIDALSWVDVARAEPCRPGLSCAYQVRVRPDVRVDVYRWSFGDPSAATMDTTQPSTSHVFRVGGTYDVTVTAFSGDREVRPLKRTEVVCTGGVGAVCDPNGAECCVGSCRLGECR